MATSDIMAYELKNKTLYELIFKQRNVLLDIALILSSVVFLGVMANIQIPLWPVPITMQTFGVIFIAFLFNSKGYRGYSQPEQRRLKKPLLHPLKHQGIEVYYERILTIN